MPKKIQLKEDYPSEYMAWKNIKQRCYNKNRPDYMYYGGRGIKVCDSWLKDFNSFIKDMGPKPSPKHSIERENVDGDYCPTNCSWATHTTQMRNTRKNPKFTYKGETKTIPEWAEITGVNLRTLQERLGILKWDIKRAIEEPIKEMNLAVEYNGVVKTLKEWAKDYGLNEQRLYHRLWEGWSIEDALVRPVKKTIKQITYHNETKSMKQWSKDLNISYTLLKSRFQLGWTVERAFEEPKREY